MVPRRDFASGFESSYQFEVLVASFISEIWADRSPANVVVERSFGVDLAAVFEDAVTMAVFRRRLIRRPSSSVEV